MSGCSFRYFLYFGDMLSKLFHSHVQLSGWSNPPPKKVFVSLNRKGSRKLKMCILCVYFRVLVLWNRPTKDLAMSIWIHCNVTGIFSMCSKAQSWLFTAWHNMDTTPAIMTQCWPSFCLLNIFQFVHCFCLDFTLVIPNWHWLKTHGFLLPLPSAFYRV